MVSKNMECNLKVKKDDLLRKGKLKHAAISREMYIKEYSISRKDLESAKKSFEDENYKWAAIQAYLLS